MRRYAYSKIIVIFLVCCFIYYVVNSYKLLFLNPTPIENSPILSAQKLQNTEVVKNVDLSPHNEGQSEKSPKKTLSLVQTPNEKHPVILVWTTSSFIEEKGIEFISTEEYGSCRVTMDRTTINQSLAVVIFNNNIKLAAMDIPDPKTRYTDI